VQPLRIGRDVTWAASVLAMLDQIRSDYVIVMLEDFLLMETVDNAGIERLADIARSERVGCLRLYSIFPPETPLLEHPGLGSFAPGDSWRITAQAAIWRIETLRALLVPGFNAWDFELVGSQMSDFMPDRIWGVSQPALVYDHAVEKGRWRPQGLAICRAAGIEVDLSKRGAFTEAELRLHEQAALESSTLALHKTEAIGCFRAGDRGAGLGAISWCLRRAPLSPQLWAIAAAGCLGPGAMTGLQRLHLRTKVARARRAYARALRSAESRPAPLAAPRPADRQQ